MAMATTKNYVDLAQLVLRFGMIERKTKHEDGETYESDATHTVMLGVVACQFAARHYPWMDLGAVAQYALVHDLVEVYAGDVNTLHGLSDAERESKRMREAMAYRRIKRNMGGWVAGTIRDYETYSVNPSYPEEARFVKAMDKLLPKLTHILNEACTLKDSGMDRETFLKRMAEQADEMRAYAGDFPELFELKAELVRTIADMLET